MLYAAFLEDPLTWTLLALGTRSLAGRAGRRRATRTRTSAAGADGRRRRRSSRGTTPTVAASRVPRGRSRAPAVASALAVAAARVGARPDVSQLRLLLPPRLGPRAAARDEARLRGLRRADRAPAVRRAVRASSGCVGEDADRAARARLPALARRARVGDLPRRRGVLRPLAGVARRAVRRARASPSCSTPRARTSTSRSWRSCCGRRRSRPGAPRRGRAVMAPARRRRAAAPRGVGARRGLLAVVRLARRPRSHASASTARARRRGAADLGRRRPVGHRRPAVLAARDERPRRRARPRRGLADVPRSFVSFVVDTARPPVALRGARRASCSPWRLRARARAARAARAVRRRRDHVRRHRARRALDPAALPDGAGRSRCACSPATACWASRRCGPGRVRRCGRARRRRPPSLGAVVRASIKAPVIDTLRGELRFIRGTHDEPGRDPRRRRRCRRDLRCGPLTFPNYRLVPDTRWHARPAADGASARAARSGAPAAWRSSSSARRS